MHREKFHEVIEQAATELEEIETVREIAIKSAREIIRTSRKIIHEVHLEKDVSEDFKKLKEAMMNVRTLCEKIDKNKILPVLEDAYQEYAEAYLFLAIVREEDIPSHRELGITPTAYLLALGDLIGELRRYCLNNLKIGNFEKGNQILEIMEEIYREIELLDFPAAIAPVRHKVDIARAIMDKTRSDVVYAKIMKKNHS